MFLFKWNVPIRFGNFSAETVAVEFTSLWAGIAIFSSGTSCAPQSGGSLMRKVVRRATYSFNQESDSWCPLTFNCPSGGALLTIYHTEGAFHLTGLTLYSIARSHCLPLCATLVQQWSFHPPLIYGPCISDSLVRTLLADTCCLWPSIRHGPRGGIFKLIIPSARSNSINGNNRPGYLLVCTWSLTFLPI